MISRRKLSVMFGALLLSACGQTTTTTSSVVVQWSLAVEANQEFARVLDLDPRNPPALVALARITLQQEAN